MNELLKSKGFKIISIDYYPNYHKYYIRKLRSEKMTIQDCEDLCKIGELLNLKYDGYYIEFDLKILN